MKKDIFTVVIIVEVLAALISMGLLFFRCRCDDLSYFSCDFCYCFGSFLSSAEEFGRNKKEKDPPVYGADHVDPHCGGDRRSRDSCDRIDVDVLINRVCESLSGVLMIWTNW